MVYINSRGEVDQGDSLSWSRLKRTFWNFVDGVLLFFQTLINPSASRRGDRFVTDYRAPSSRFGRQQPQRRIGGLGSTGSPSCPPMAGGG